MTATEKSELILRRIQKKKSTSSGKKMELQLLNKMLSDLNKNFKGYFANLWEKKSI